VPKTDKRGIELRYKDALGKWHRTSEETRSAIINAMGEPVSEPAPVLVVRAGQRKRVRGPAEMTLEDGSIVQVTAALPPDLPSGYHTLRYFDNDETSRLIVSPPCCYLPEDLRIWGWSVQLYALRSCLSWGIGDLSDLRRLARWSAEQLDARILLINPLCSASPIFPQQPSPYFPSSRRYRNLLYLRIQEIPGAAELKLELDRLGQPGTALNNQRRIDRDAVFTLKMDALRLLWSRFNGDPAFDRFCKEQGDALVQFATFCALAEHHRCGWHQWPAEHRHPDSAAVARFAAEQESRVRFHQWVQWLLDEQLARVAAHISLMQDLPIGVDPDGADAWAWQDLLASGATVGAPPDEYNTQGQNWGLPPFVPWKLRRAAYEPFIQTIRAALRRAGGLRIDHVMGLFRLFWIPAGAEPGAGAYVRYPAEELLAIVALESQRAKGYIVGEDLGTVEEAARKQLAERHVLSYRLFWFETKPPAEYPKHALAAVTTHDLPTVAGLWSGSDLKVQHELGLKPNDEGIEKIRERLRSMAGLADESSMVQVVTRTHDLLAQAPSVIVTATMDDALALEERPNMPGTTGGRWPNWSLALPQLQEDLERNDLALAIARALKAGRAG
jgi:4-alpha-glucanotransferase